MPPTLLRQWYFFLLLLFAEYAVNPPLQPTAPAFPPSCTLNTTLFRPYFSQTCASPALPRFSAALSLEPCRPFSRPAAKSLDSGEISGPFPSSMDRGPFSISNHPFGANLFPFFSEAMRSRCYSWPHGLFLLVVFPEGESLSPSDERVCFFIPR